MQELGEPLHEIVDGAAEITGDATEEEPQSEADGEPDEADEERCAGAEEHAAEQVTAEEIRTGKEDAAAFGDAEQMNVRLDHTEQSVGLALDEQAQLVAGRPVHRIFTLEGFAIEFVLEAIDERTEVKPAFVVDELDARRRGKQMLSMPLERIVGRDELGDEDDRVEEDYEAQRDHGDPVPAEFDPEQLAAGQNAPPPAGRPAFRCRVRWSSQFARDMRTRGSRIVSRMSDITTPTTVRTPSIIRQLAAT